MNREIKFRAWNPFDQKMYAPTSDDTMMDPISYDLSIWGNGWEICAITATGKQIVVASETRDGESGGILMQYTGLKDKNGVEIYEGDIVQLGGTFKYTVQWIESAQFKLKSTNRLDGRGYTVSHAVKYGEVIGNIYQNPELLK